MPFPITFGDRVFSDGPRLLQAVATDAERGGGGIVTGQAPDEWLPELVDDGALTLKELRGLAGALIQAGLAGSLSTGARLARRLRDPELGVLLLRALSAHEMGVLFAIDPLDGQKAVEDVVLDAASSCVDLTDPELRSILLERLRTAGRPDREVFVLVRHATPEEVERWLPGLLAEDLSLDLLRGLSELGRKSLAHGIAVDRALDQVDRKRRVALVKLLGRAEA